MSVQAISVQQPITYRLRVIRELSEAVKKNALTRVCACECMRTRAMGWAGVGEGEEGARGGGGFMGSELFVSMGDLVLHKCHFLRNSTLVELPMFCASYAGLSTERVSPLLSSPHFAERRRAAVAGC